ncbi:hypothetical protein BV22DRAFT_1029287 [Leucogyrophana mollusca]|uniref:Uncharacterized protein n=1 Tax=Leucogyrophana mollusca TaxID=85980 RepID=A0ACB8BWP5_9AGAM|nr:hypothetical protein BV22DRAFT_1029287 [Leucogyrophana mollusca]
MDSDIGILYSYQSMNYLLMALVVVVMYDHGKWNFSCISPSLPTGSYITVLTFSQEVDRIWSCRWSLATILYIVARYSGAVFVFAIASAYLRLNWTRTGAQSITTAISWSSTVFTIAMQAILIMWAYALCNRSKKVLVCLLVCFFCQTVVVIAFCGMECNNFINWNHVVSVGAPIGSVAQGEDTDLSALGPLVMIGFELIFDVVLLVIAVLAFVKHALQARRWSISPLMKVLIADQVLYFLCYVVRQAAITPTLVANFAPARSVLLARATAATNALMIIAGPRMVVNLRVQEVRTREGTFQEELSAIQFSTRDMLAQSIVEEYPESGVEQAPDLGLQVLS